MKRLELYKSASDFAFLSLATSNPIELDIAVATEFKKQKLDPKDYQYWRQSFAQCRQLFLNLSNQNAPSFVPPVKQPEPAKK